MTHPPPPPRGHAESVSETVIELSLVWVHHPDDIRDVLRFTASCDLVHRRRGWFLRALLMLREVRKG